MKLSIAMCTFNGEKYLREQLASLAAQSRRPDELIVCDDGSTDDTTAIIEQFKKGAPFPVSLQINSTNLGSTKNFEQAVRMCTGDLIFFCDQDDVWQPEKLQRLEEEFQNHKSSGLLFSDGDVVDGELQSLGRSVWELIRFGPAEQRQVRRGLAFDVLLDHNVATGAALGFRAEFRELMVPFPDDLTHDGAPVLHDWWAALMVAAVADVSFIDERLFKYRQHSGQQLGVLSALETTAQTEEGVAAAASRRNEYDDEIHYLKTVRQRLTEVAKFDVNPQALARLDAQLAHLETRAQMPANRLRRAPAVLGELLKRRYHLYSNGFSSAAKDLLT